MLVFTLSCISSDFAFAKKRGDSKKISLTGKVEERRSVGMWFYYFVKNNNNQTEILIGSISGTNPDAKECLNAAAENKSNVTISGVLETYEDGSSGFDEETVVCVPAGETVKVFRYHAAASLQDDPGALIRIQNAEDRKKYVDYFNQSERSEIYMYPDTMELAIIFKDGSRSKRYHYSYENYAAGGKEYSVWEFAPGKNDLIVSASVIEVFPDESEKLAVSFGMNNDPYFIFLPLPYCNSVFEKDPTQGLIQ